ncbi:hypothetical protein C8R42DRAFT_714156 [Lentinula raphanica]|nr:hypothetical protein C8R42DRAFT_714156 [Lentinula raphanica]
MMFYLRTIHLVFGLILIGAVKAVPMPPSGTTSESPEPLAPSSGEDLLEYRNDLDIAYQNLNPQYADRTDEMIQLDIKKLQADKYRHSGWIQVIISFNTRTDSLEPAHRSGNYNGSPPPPPPTIRKKLLLKFSKLLKSFKGSPSPSPDTTKKMLKKEAGVTEEDELMLKESIQHWSGREVPWDKALGVVFMYRGRLEPGVYGFDYSVSWVLGKPPAKVNLDDEHDVVFIQLDRQLPKGWSEQSRAHRHR